MKIFEAIENLKNGFIVRRSAWGQGFYVEKVNDQVYLIYNSPGSTKIITTNEKFSIDDILADDWVLKN